MNMPVESELRNWHYLNVNRSYLYTIFAIELHISPKDFLQKYRVTRARELLVLTELSVESIGKSCGYGNAERFARAFTKTGLTKFNSVSKAGQK